MNERRRFFVPKRFGRAKARKIVKNSGLRRGADFDILPSMSGRFQKGKAWGWAVLICALGVAAGNARAAEWFVATNGNDAAAGTNWATAKLTIQAAVDAATNGSTVWVSNGVYATGGRVAAGSLLTNRVAINKPITVQSVNGPEGTIIHGARDSASTNGCGDAAVRCAYVGTNAVLSGFTLTNGATRTSGFNKERYAGGAWCETGGVLSNCVLTGNLAYDFGGGSCYGTVNNCVLTGNSAQRGGGSSFGGALNYCVLTSNSSGQGGGSYNGTLNHCVLRGNSSIQGGGSCYGTLINCSLVRNWAGSGGGASDATLINCTLTLNSAENCGGAYRSTLTNCIVYYNVAYTNPNHDHGTFSHSCTTPDPGGAGNTTNEPMLASASHLAVESPCVGAGNSACASGTDLDGDAWGSPPSMGCDEVVVGSITGALSVGAWAAHTNMAVGFPVQFMADISGRTTASVWQWGDGAVSSNQPYTTHSFSAAGIYNVTLIAYNESYPLGVATSVTVQVATQMVHHVAIGNATPSSPYSSWETASTNIQEAIDIASQAGALVLVSDGVYSSGGLAVDGTTTNRVVINKPVTVQSVNGPEWTTIKGSKGCCSPPFAAVRCAFVGTNAILSGFTLTNGAEKIGGGAWCEADGVLTNCLLTGNSAGISGGGSYRGTLNNCTLVGNYASTSGGGSYQGTLNNCTLTGNSAGSNGGGSCEGILNNCTLTGNSAGSNGGGSYLATLNTCTLIGNSATNWGGGSDYGKLTDCLVASNSAQFGGGSYGSTQNNCRLIGNVAQTSGGGSYDGALNGCLVAYNQAHYGGGFYYEGPHTILNNCVVASNTAQEGGGVWCNFESGGAINNCTLIGNSATANAGGVYLWRGGESSGEINNCRLIGNSAWYGGGAYGYFSCASFNNCLFTGNSATKRGGACAGTISAGGFEPPMYYTTLKNCTISGNSAGTGGGVSGVNLKNCIVHFNTAATSSNFGSGSFSNCCTTPMPGGTDNITNNPQFVDAAAGNYRLKTNSPCIDRGSNALVQGTMDLDGNPRILNGVVDMGAYETQLYTGFRAWAAVITNGLTNDTDCAAGDGVPNLLRYAAGGSPMAADGLARLDLAFENGVPALRFNRNPNATDITLLIQGADEMSDAAEWRGLATNLNGAWGGAANVSETGQGNPVACTVEDVVPLQTNRFLRLKVTRP